ncbi:hypothetical protein PHYPSEUDO_006675 [Phytophthora pseudosyringae]|uniref:Uncharacterized protein n=1 Tax=Phytophthora pseudosyringae TaxID=221518 RepID=A0A8T1VI39_9STRA|nr:hypothetical protein PHYPSEUDO_006675 [Phytophthora pseudosyringae]
MFDRSPAMIALEAGLKQRTRDLERAHARVAALEEKNALVLGSLDAAEAASDEKMLRICALEEKATRLQLSSKDTKRLKEDRAVRGALEKEMQRLHRQSTDLEDAHKDELDKVKTQHEHELKQAEDRHRQELKQAEECYTQKLKLAEDRHLAMESLLRANRAALNSKETALRVTLARLNALEEETEAKDEDFEDEGASLRAQVQALQRQLGRSLHDIETLTAAVVSIKQRYKDDFALWLESMTEVLAAAPTNRAPPDPPRPFTA